MSNWRMGVAMAAESKQLAGNNVLGSNAMQV
jgi:hypothetical protein